MLMVVQDMVNITVANWHKYFNKEYNVEVDKDGDGRIKVYSPQNRYENSKGLKLTEDGKGTFCSFKITDASTKAGTYVFTVKNVPYYVGKCVNLYKRVNSGYGVISPRNCYKGGQNTNCRINKNILEESRAGKTIKLYFYKNDNREKVEKETISCLKTIDRWNKQK